MKYDRSTYGGFTAVMVLLLLVVALSPLSFSQGTSGTISGVVKDQSGAVVPGATVTVKNLDTNMARTITSEGNGQFLIPGLPSGPYELTAELPGFAKYVRSPINLLLNQSAVVDPVLRPAATSQTIVVTEDAPLLNTTTAEVGVLFDAKRLQRPA